MESSCIYKYKKKELLNAIDTEFIYKKIILIINLFI